MLHIASIATFPSTEAIEISYRAAEVLEMLLEHDGDAVVHGACAVLENRHLNGHCCWLAVVEAIAQLPRPVPPRGDSILKGRVSGGVDFRPAEVG